MSVNPPTALGRRGCLSGQPQDQQDVRRAGCAAVDVGVVAKMPRPPRRPVEVIRIKLPPRPPLPRRSGSWWRPDLAAPAASRTTVVRPLLALLTTSQLDADPVPAFRSLPARTPAPDQSPSS